MRRKLGSASETARQSPLPGVAVSDTDFAASEQAVSAPASNEQAESTPEVSSPPAHDRPASEPEANEQMLPSFITAGTRTDRLLFAGFFAISLFYLALIPFRAKLLVDAPLFNVFLTGGSMSTVALAAQHAGQWLFLGFVALTAALSSIKFLPLYFFMGKRWGPEFIAFMFKSHKPLWFRWLENFIFKHPLIALGLCFIPFFPASPTIVVIIAGITRVRGLPLAVSAIIYALLLKLLYLTLGVLFGEAVIATLQVIDKYMLWITLGLVAWLMFVSFRKELKAPRQTAQD